MCMGALCCLKKIEIKNKISIFWTAAGSELQQNEQESAI